MNLYLDIETIPSQRADVRAFLARTVRHPKTLSKPESIKAWYADHIVQAIDEEVSKTGLDGTFGQVVCIGLQIDDEACEAVFGLDEVDVLTRLNEWLTRIPQSEIFTTVVIGHNVSNFDLRFLMQRFIARAIKPHPVLARAATAKPWEVDKVFDTMVQFAGPGNRISLDKLCMALSLEGKGDITGADVWPMVQDGRLEEVAQYCLHDVRLTRDVHRRMTFS